MCVQQNDSTWHLICLLSLDGCSCLVTACLEVIGHTWCTSGRYQVSGMSFISHSRSPRFSPSLPFVCRREVDDIRSHRIEAHLVKKSCAVKSSLGCLGTCSLPCDIIERSDICLEYVVRPPPCFVDHLTYFMSWLILWGTVLCKCVTDYMCVCVTRCVEIRDFGLLDWVMVCMLTPHWNPGQQAYFETHVTGFVVVLNSFECSVTVDIVIAVSAGWLYSGCLYAAWGAYTCCCTRFLTWFSDVYRLEP